MNVTKPHQKTQNYTLIIVIDNLYEVVYDAC